IDAPDDHREHRRVAHEAFDEQGAETPVESERREESVSPPEAVEAEHEAALARVVLELTAAQVDARHVARGAGALDRELGRPRHERLAARHEDTHGGAN